MIANVGDLPYVIVIAVVVLIGGSQLPKIARNLGLAGKEFRKAQREAEEESQGHATTNPLAPTPLGPATTPVAPAAGAATVPAVGQNTDEGSITLSPAQLDALLRAHEEQVRHDGTNN